MGALKLHELKKVLQILYYWLNFKKPLFLFLKIYCSSTYFKHIFYVLHNFVLMQPYLTFQAGRLGGAPAGGKESKNLSPEDTQNC